MDERYLLHGIEFSWNVQKSATNEERHGVSFRKAAEAFFDPFFQVEDATKTAEELRQAVLGLTKDWKLLFVGFQGDRERPPTHFGPTSYIAGTEAL